MRRKLPGRKIIVQVKANEAKGALMNERELLSACCLRIEHRSN